MCVFTCGLLCVCTYKCVYVLAHMCVCTVQVCICAHLCFTVSGHLYAHLIHSGPLFVADIINVSNYYLLLYYFTMVTIKDFN